MRLLTAIPLLFWTSTAAIAHLAVILAAQPSPAVTHARSAEPSITSAAQHAPAMLAESRFAAAVFAGFPAHGRTAQDFPAAAIERSTTADGPCRQTRQILHAARLSANPPPTEV